MTRICMIAYKAPPVYGGAGAQALRLARQLQTRDISTSMLTARHSANAASHEFMDAVAVHRLPVVKAGRLQPFTFSCAAAWHMLRNHRRYDIFHIHGAYWRIVPPLLAAKLTGKKIIVKMTQFGTDDPLSIRRRRFGRFLADALARADAVVAISDHLAASYEQAGLPSERLFRIPNGVDTDTFGPIDARTREKLRVDLGFSPAAPVVLFVGAVDWRKGVDLLLQSWPQVREQFPESALALVGPLNAASPLYKGRPYVEYVRDYVDHHGTTQRIHILGQQTEVQRFYQIADIFVLPSRMEGLPNALLEAMACGLPVVATAVGGSLEVVQNNVNGLLVQPNDVDALTRAILYFLRYRGQAHKNGQAARQMILNCYSLEIVADQYAKLYACLLDLEE